MKEAKEAKEAKVSISARIPDWIKRILEESAKENERSVSQELSLRLKQSIEKQSPKSAVTQLRDLLSKKST